MVSILGRLRVIADSCLEAEETNTDGDEISDELCGTIYPGTMKDHSTVEGCHHSFCGECLDDWSKRRSRCPICACQSTVVHCRHRGADSPHLQFSISLD
ncbi:hypothetical protein FOZ63_031046 [Perkinsus olseni]|uniref:RING-type domain-containing protein n=1 Tax=Perkinsus olseni TaxID=32597 RepID=A0A7J6RJZ6_PEROL|nr:hypothetical protein FOZ60_014681 [Perkinsus olseni]KAF4720893.1 hypothetical protein FOZ63_031046 [Perkinsus olseni]